MAEPSKFSGLLQQMGILSPTERSAQQYQNQMQQLQMMQLNQQVANQGASRYGLFGGPVAQAEAQRMGNPSSFQIPELPQMENTAPAQQIMQQSMQTGGSQSSQLYKASQDLLKMGDTQRAYQAYAAAVQAAQMEQEEQRKQAELFQKMEKHQWERNALSEPSGVETIMAGGDKRKSIRKLRDEQGRYIGDEVLGEGTVGSDSVNVNLGGLLTEAQSGDELRTLADKITAARGFTRMIGSVRSQLQKGGKTGIPQQVFSFIDEVISTTKQVVVDPDVSGYANELLNDSRWQEKMKATHITKSQLIQIAYQRAKMFDQDGRIAKDDFKNAMDQLGARLSSPEAVLSVLLENAAQGINEIEEAYERTGALTPIPKSLAELKAKLTGEYTELSKGSNEIPEDPEADPSSPGPGWRETSPGSGIWVRE